MITSVCFHLSLVHLPDKYSNCAAIITVKQLINSTSFADGLNKNTAIQNNTEKTVIVVNTASSKVKTPFSSNLSYV